MSTTAEKIIKLRGYLARVPWYKPGFLSRSGLAERVKSLAKALRFNALALASQAYLNGIQYTNSIEPETRYRAVCKQWLEQLSVSGNDFDYRPNELTPEDYM